MQTAVEQDPLNMPAGSVEEAKFPVLPEKLYVMTIAAVEDKASNTKEGVKMLKITLKTTKEETAFNGDIVNAGFPVFFNWVYTPTGDLTPTMIAQQAKGIIEACGLPATTTAANLRDNPQMIVDKVVTIKLKIRKASGNFGEGNEVARGGWIKPS